jgi:hypothetical protein
LRVGGLRMPAVAEKQGQGLMPSQAPTVIDDAGREAGEEKLGRLPSAESRFADAA